MHATKCSLHFDKPQKNEIHSLNNCIHAISHTEIKSHRIWSIWKPVPTRFFKSHRIFRPSYNIFKFILGVNKYAPNLASKAELGRYPVVISALLHSIKYWLYLNENPFEKHSRFSYLSQIHKDGGAVSTFSHQIC